MSAVSWYAESALLLGLGALVLWGVARGLRATAAAHPQWFIALGLALLVGALALPAALRLVQPRPAGAAVHVWSVEPRARDVTRKQVVALSWSPARGAPSLRAARTVGQLAAGAFACVAGLLLLRIVTAQLRLRRLCRVLPVVRRVGRVRVLASEHIGSPFAARAGGGAVIVVPTDALADLPTLRVIIAHEAAHLRAGDPFVAVALELLRALFFWNPAAHVWPPVMTELQERRCDARVARRFSARACGEALLWAATLGEARRHALPAFPSVPAMAGSSHQHLKRRIEMLYKPRPTRTRSLITMAATVAAAAVTLTATAAAVNGAVADHRIAPDEVARMAADLQTRLGFPVLGDEGVADALNAAVATPKGRAELEAALTRLPQFQATMAEKLRAAHVPEPLMALAVFESGVQTNTTSSMGSRGLWQFIPQTARHYGLRVDDAVDDRLDPEKDSAAAAAYLSDLYRVFGDWPTAVVAYNSGEKRVATLLGLPANAGKPARAVLPPRYLSGVMATLIVMHNPQLLRR